MEVPKQRHRGGSYEITLETNAQAAAFGKAWGKLGEAWIGYRKQVGIPLVQICSPHTLAGIYEALVEQAEPITHPDTRLPERDVNREAILAVKTAVGNALGELPSQACTPPPLEWRGETIHFATINDDLLPE